MRKHPSRPRHGTWIATLTAGLLLLTGCADANPFGASAGPKDPSDPIVVGSADFPESEVIAEIYAGVLRDAGFTVETQTGIGAREAYVGAVKDGSVDLVPEYNGNLLLYLDPHATATSDQEINAALPAALEKEGLEAYRSSPAEDKDSLAVTRQSAEKYHLKSIADLTPHCKDLALGAPPEFKERAYGVKGLERNYGCTFRSVETINDGGGPLTVKALVEDDVQVANLFTTVPAIKQQDLVSLEDPKQNFMAAKVLPLTSKDRLPDEARKALDEFAPKLTTEDLLELNVKVSGEEQMNPATAAKQWLADRGY